MAHAYKTRPERCCTLHNVMQICGHVECTVVYVYSVYNSHLAFILKYSVQWHCINQNALILFVLCSVVSDKL